MNAGQVDILLILGANPVYTAPADLRFADAMEKVPLRVHLSSHEDETSERCHWQIPEAHFLEAWSDVRAHDGTVSIVQPLIAPLYGGRTAHEVIGALGDNPETSPYDTVREHWLKQTSPGASRADAGVRDGMAPLAARRRHGQLGVHSAPVPLRSDACLSLTAVAAPRIRLQPDRAGRDRARDLVPQRSLRARRPVREQRLAAGTARNRSRS